MGGGKETGLKRPPWEKGKVAVEPVELGCAGLMWSGTELILHAAGKYGQKRLGLVDTDGKMLPPPLPVRSRQELGFRECSN
jgi:hypothetical protein